MKKALLLSLVLIAATVACNKTHSSKPSLTDAQKITLYKTQVDANLALEKIKVTTQYAALMKAQQEQDVALNKLKVSPDYKTFEAAQKAQDAAMKAVQDSPDYKILQSAQKAQNDAVQAALKGVDQTKWKLNQDLSFEEVKK